MSAPSSASISVLKSWSIHVTRTWWFRANRQKMSKDKGIVFAETSLLNIADQVLRKAQVRFQICRKILLYKHTLSCCHNCTNRKGQGPIRYPDLHPCRTWRCRIVQHDATCFQDSLPVSPHHLLRRSLPWHLGQWLVAVMRTNVKEGLLKLTLRIHSEQQHSRHSALHSHSKSLKIESVSSGWVGCTGAP